MTLKDIARLANCSTATVSRVINNEKGVSEETRAYIQRVIDENGYQPNKQAKGLAEQKTNTLLFVYENTPDNPFFTELIRGAIDGAKEAHQILLFNIICDSYVTDYFLNALRSDQIDGVNDHDWQADLLAEKIHGMPGHVNLIPLNDVVESEFKPSKRVAAFQKRLASHGLTATVRRSLGGDIDASCGQLRRKEMKAREGVAQ